MFSISEARIGCLRLLRAATRTIPIAAIPYKSSRQACRESYFSSKICPQTASYLCTSFRFYSSRNTKTCWKCHQQSKEDSLLCNNDHCQAVQAVGKETNYYDVLLDGQTPSFDIDHGLLRRNFLKYQQVVHPDSFSQKEEIERKLAETQSSWINHAYSTLKDPLLRAQYMLKLQGNEIGEEEQVTDPELLMQVMETREEIEMAKTEEQIDKVRQHNEQNMDDVINRLSGAFKQKDLDRARQLTNQLQYFQRIAQAVNIWEPGKPVIISH